ARLGDRWDCLRHPRRQDRPRQDDDPDDSGLLRLHGPERPLHGGVGLRAVSIPDRPWCRRTARRQRLAGCGSRLGPRPSAGARRVCAMALGSLQALSAVGNMLAAVTSMVLGKYEQSGVIGSAWRAMFLVGTVPALLVIPIFLRLKEPERWKAAAREGELDGDG